MSDNQTTTSTARQRYRRPRLERLGSFEELTRTGGGNQVQADPVDYPNVPTVS